MLTFLMPVEEDALSFQDQNYVFWIWPIYHLGRLRAQKLICFIDFLKHILQIKRNSLKSCQEPSKLLQACSSALDAGKNREFQVINCNTSFDALLHFRQHWCRDQFSFVS